MRLQGLSNAAYNGKIVRIESISADAETTGEYRVVLLVDEVASTLSQEILVKPEHMVRACDCCRLAGAATMQYCGRCKNAAYCNAECQRSDWKQHKVVCSHMNSQRQIVKSRLHLAATLGNLTEVQDLVRAGADVNKATTEDGCSPLYMAAENGNLAVVRYLVLQGADNDKVTSTGSTSLFIAAQLGHLAVGSIWCSRELTRTRPTRRAALPSLWQLSRVIWR